jgi:hypothetical protein
MFLLPPHDSPCHLRPLSPLPLSPLSSRQRRYRPEINDSDLIVSFMSGSITGPLTSGSITGPLTSGPHPILRQAANPLADLCRPRIG